jgi:hypothetical protein
MCLFARNVHDFAMMVRWNIVETRQQVGLQKIHQVRVSRKAISRFDTFRRYRLSSRICIQDATSPAVEKIGVWRMSTSAGRAPFAKAREAMTKVVAIPVAHIIASGRKCEWAA